MYPCRYICFEKRDSPVEIIATYSSIACTTNYIGKIDNYFFLNYANNVVVVKEPSESAASLERRFLLFLFTILYTGEFVRS
jgi:hypothetical protein